MSSTNDPKTPPTPDVNQRREARVDARIKVAIVRGRRMESLETSDVSFKGLFLRTSEPPPVRSLMRLRVALPMRVESYVDGDEANGNTCEIEAHAMAVHVSPPSTTDARHAGVGVQFWGLAGPDRALWDDFVRELIQARRVAAKKLAESDENGENAVVDPLTPSGIRAAPTVEAPSSSRASGDD